MPSAVQENSVVDHEHEVLMAAREKLRGSPYPEAQAAAAVLVYHEGVLILHGKFTRWFFVQMAQVALSFGRLEGVDEFKLNVDVKKPAEEPRRQFDWEIPI